MNDRIHDFLDGEIPRTAVPPDAQEELREIEDAVGAARSWVRNRPAPDLTSRVMTALPSPAPTPVEAVPSAWTRLLEGIRWVWIPQSFALRPLTAFALAALLAAGVWSAGGSITEPATELAAVQAESPAQPLYIQFRLDTENASDVALAGSFTEWQPSYTLHETAPGVWTVLVPLEPGVHDYLFIVDGERWVSDPVAPPVDDGFGGTNSRLLLPVPSGA